MSDMARRAPATKLERNHSTTSSTTIRMNEQLCTVRGRQWQSLIMCPLITNQLTRPARLSVSEMIAPIMDCSVHTVPESAAEILVVIGNNHTTHKI